MKIPKEQIYLIHLKIRLNSKIVINSLKKRIPHQNHKLKRNNKNLQILKTQEKLHNNNYMMMLKKKNQKWQKKCKRKRLKNNSKYSMMETLNYVKFLRNQMWALLQLKKNIKLLKHICKVVERKDFKLNFKKMKKKKWMNKLLSRCLKKIKNSLSNSLWLFINRTPYSNKHLELTQPVWVYFRNTKWCYNIKELENLVN